jgi:hypothetical protein
MNDECGSSQDQYADSLVSSLFRPILLCRNWQGVVRSTIGIIARNRKEAKDSKARQARHYYRYMNMSNPYLYPVKIMNPKSKSEIPTVKRARAGERALYGGSCFRETDAHFRKCQRKAFFWFIGKQKKEQTSIERTSPSTYSRYSLLYPESHAATGKKVRKTTRPVASAATTNKKKKETVTVPRWSTTYDLLLRLKVY